MNKNKNLDEQFARLWTESQAKVAAYIRSLVPDSHAAEDILQDVAVICIKKMSVYNPDYSFKYWAFGIARNVMHSYWRKNSRYFLLEDPDITEKIADANESLSDELDGRSEFLKKCIKQLSDKQKRLLKFRYDEELSIASVADKTGNATGSVKVILSRIRKGLRNCIEKKLAMEKAW